MYLKKLMIISMVVLMMMTASKVIAEQGALCYVEGPLGGAWIFGSIHVGSEEMYPFSQAVSEAYSSADYWVFECDSSKEAGEAVNSLLYYSSGDALTNHVGEETMHLLKETAQKMNWNIQNLLSIKPWGLTSMLTVQCIAAQFGVENAKAAIELGVERKLMEKHKNQELLYFETAEEQAKMLNGYSDELQEYLLKDSLLTVLGYQTETENLKSWPQWWNNGDLSAFSETFEEEIDLIQNKKIEQEYRNSTLTARNRKMADRLENWLQTRKGVFFVTVGIMHLVTAEDSLIIMLEEDGYTVKK